MVVDALWDESEDWAAEARVLMAPLRLSTVIMARMKKRIRNLMEFK